ncbi:nucleotide triphosphate diphosphatase NUDT15 isoform X1 [Nycticebus coucang]|uniref:nucleotide triphosphate diphosphatase NUDT15 isoform X1 n=1 Tax=Nycticebus coucang TaxID=9470 RepID=UPI00234DF083|nr:nucleotide triphosphate diphosphatase NUDT15 isoform X1 [Nycticebus coucang]
MRKSKKNKLSRQWSLILTTQPLKEEESYHPSVSRFSKKDYKLIRHQSLFGTYGERTTELQLLLEEAKENSVPQLIMYNWKVEGDFRNTEVLEENVNDYPLLQWVNLFHQMGNAILSNKGKNPICKVTNWLTLDAREFLFSLNFNLNNKLLDYAIPSEEYMNIKYMQSCRYQKHQENTLQIHNQEARRPKGKISRLTTGLSNVRRNSQRPLPWMDRLRKTVPELGEHEIYTRATQQNRNDTVSKAQKRNEFTELKSRRVRSNSSLDILRQRFEVLRTRPTQNKRQQPQFPKEGVTSRRQCILRKINRYHPYHMVGQNKQTIKDTVIKLLSHSAAPSRFRNKDVRSQPSIRLSLQVRILQGEIAQRNISSRTSTIQRTGKIGSYRSSRGISQLIISFSKFSGAQTCIRTTWLPLQGISETCYGRSMVLKALVRFSTLSFSNESWSYLEKQWARQHSWDVNLLFNNLKRITQHELNEALISCPKDNNVVQNKDINNLTENIILQMLRLASVFLLRNNARIHLRGLTNNKETNKVFITKYKTSKDKEDRACINPCKHLHRGNTLRQLPCAYEFLTHGTHHWPAENSMCPICHQILSESNTV